jgi:hypothetical protein
MSTPLRVGAFVVGLAAVFGLAFGVGAVTDLNDPKVAPSADEAYVLRLDQDRADPGRRALRFTIDDREGDPVTRCDLRHEKRLHLIAVNTDFSGFQHVHPTMAADGTWSTDLDLSTGPWRVYADFQPAGGQNVVASADLEVSGSSAPAPDFSMLRSTTVDGFTVTALGDLSVGAGSRLTFEISKDGKAVTDLEPYLGAYGHLVVLRAKDMAYLHVHPEDGAAGPDVAFMAEVSHVGTYHLYLDFKHGDVVRTAHFVLSAGDGPNGPMEDTDHGGGHDSH